MVIEPIQGEGGFVVPAPGFLAGLREIADRYGIVLVIDEIQAGMGRTGTLFASEHEGVAGDITLSAKALADGVPLSAVTGRAELMNAVHAGGLGGTYAGNPLACEAALAVFEAFEDGTLLDNARAIEAAARKVLEPLVDRDRRRGRVPRTRRHAGRWNSPTAARSPRARTSPRTISARCHAHGVLTLTCGTYGNIIRLLPPLVIGPTCSPTACRCCARPSSTSGRHGAADAAAQSGTGHRAPASHLRHVPAPQKEEPCP